MPSQSKLNGIFAKKLKRLDKTLDGFADVLDTVMVDLINQVQAYVGAFKAGRELKTSELLQLVQAGQAKQDIAEMLGRAGYDDLVETFVEQYDDYTVEFLRDVTKEMGVPLSFTAADVDLMDQLKGFDIQKALGVKDNLANALSVGLGQMAMGNQSLAATLALMRDVPGVHVGHLKAQLNTGMASFDALIMADQMQKAGFERFRYYGPSDKVIRPFCAEVLKMQEEKGFFTKQDIKNLAPLREGMGGAQGLSDDVFVTRGGWNCRHSWGVTVEDAPVKPKPAPKPAAPPEMTGADYMMQQIGPQRGSNLGGVYRGKDGIKRYIKQYDDPAQAYNEHLASEMYRGMAKHAKVKAYNAPKSTVFKHKGKTYYASEIVEDGMLLAENFGIPTKSMMREGYAADAFLANWDAAGLDLDNIIIKGGQAYRIDNGGALLFRARGGRKALDALENVDEFKTFMMPDVNPSYSRMFQAEGGGAGFPLAPFKKRVIGQIDDLMAWAKAEVGPLDFVDADVFVWQEYIKKTVPDMLDKDIKDLAWVLQRRMQGTVNYQKSLILELAALEKETAILEAVASIDWEEDEYWPALFRTLDRGEHKAGSASVVSKKAIFNGLKGDADRFYEMVQQWVGEYGGDPVHWQLYKSVARVMNGKPDFDKLVALSHTGTGFKIDEIVAKILGTRKKVWENFARQVNSFVPKNFRVFRGVHDNLDYIDDVIRAWSNDSVEFVTVRSHELSSWSFTRKFAKEWATRRRSNNWVVFEADVPIENTFADLLTGDGGFLSHSNEAEVVVAMKGKNAIAANKRGTRIAFGGKEYGYEDRNRAIDDWNKFKEEHPDAF